MIEAMKYTKWITVLFCLLGLAACRQDAPRFRIGVAQCSDDSWRHKMNDEILREAMFYDGVSVEIRSAADDNRKQAEDVHYFIDKGVDLLIISANEAAPMTPIVEEAYQKGIPVILVDRKILSDKYTAYIGADNYEIGRAVGNYIASSLKGKGNVVELTGLGGSTPAMERHQGFMAAISNYPDIKLIDKADAAWEREPAEVEMDSMLRRNPKIDAVYAHNDRIAPGAYQAAKKVGREKEMVFVGIDALPGKGNGLEMVLDSVLDATFIYPTNGDKVMQLAMNILEKNYADPQFGVKDLTERLNISYTVIYKKFVSLTGLPPVRFIQLYRLQIAKKILESSTNNIIVSEIAYRVGFNDPKYFTRCFVKQYTQTPSSFFK